MSQRIIADKKFEFTLSNIEKNFTFLSGGKYKDNEIDVEILIAPDQINLLNFDFKFKKIPKTIPFWAIIYVQINDQEIKFFLEQKENEEQFDKSFSSPFKKEMFLNGDVVIKYRITQVPAYICKLDNENECVCYLNSSIQLLFHLTKFRSLLFSLHIQKNNIWLSQLRDLFTKMCSYKTSTTTKFLTESFGWPTPARLIPHDCSEFIDFILENFRKILRDAKNQSIFDKIFASQIITQIKCSNEISYKINSQYIINISPLEGSLYQRITEEFENKKFQKFPEVLFLSVFEFYPKIKGLPKTLDLSQFADPNLINSEETLKHSKYILSGFIILFDRSNSIAHYTSAVRASNEEVWMYFTDKLETTYSWSYDPYINQTSMPLENGIKNLIGKNKIRVLMYISEDYIKEYFKFSIDVVPSKSPPKPVKTCYIGEKRKFLITTPSDVEEYVKTGHTDFRSVNSSIQFEIESELPYNSVYKKVSEIMNIPINSFILKGESPSGAPYSVTFKNSTTDLISNFSSYKVHLYFNEFDRTSEQAFKTFNQCIPFYFLLFEFKPKSFIRNLTSNLMHNKNKFVIRRAESESASKKLLKNNESQDSITKSSESDDEYLERNCYRFLTSMVLSNDIQFKSIIPKLARIMGKPEDTKIQLYVAEYQKNQKIGYTQLDINKKIKDCFKQLMNGIYIYVQCVDNFSRNSNDNGNDNNNDDDDDDDDDGTSEIKNKFLFLNYAEKAMKKHFYIKEISNIFMMENFSIPVTFCKLTDPKKIAKTMLFPITFPLTNMEQLKRIVCSIFDEEYPENGLVQLFFGFRKGSPPFNESAKSTTNIKKIVRLLTYILKNTKTKLMSLNIANTSNDSLSELGKDSDSDYLPIVSIYYHIFPQYHPSEQISIRVYFSEDSINIKCLTQILINKDTEVSEIADSLVDLFPQYLSDEDKEILTKVKQKKLVFTDYYRIIQITDGKIYRLLKFNYRIGLDAEIRFERIPNCFNENEIFGLIPVFYGARYNCTKYIGAFGTPFYFPVLKEDVEDPETKSMNTFAHSKCFLRLGNMIKGIKKGESYRIFVVNYFGLAQNVEVNDFKTIIEQKLNYVICIKYINASIFIDEIEFFKGGIRLLK